MLKPERPAIRSGDHWEPKVEGVVAVSGTNSKLQGLKVLVIDDSKTIRRTAETLLAKEGCEVFTAIDGFRRPWPRSPITSPISSSWTS